MNVADISKFIKKYKHNGLKLKKDIKQNANPVDIIKALDLSENDREIIILCDILGELHVKEAVPVLVKMLRHNSSDVRNSVADNLAKIKEPDSGEYLIQQYTDEPEDSVKRMIIVALGAVKYYPAIPICMKELSNKNPGMRGGAAWSLGALNATKAIELLQKTLSTEENLYAKARMQEALDIIV